jgi:NAD(P)-dependent dehydrogenase (short-subunit alcohol dehydrogenase family)
MARSAARSKFPKGIELRRTVNREVHMTVLDRFRLDGRRALVTGGSRGLGREMALALAEVGADIVLTGRDPASLDDAAAAVRARGRAAVPIAADMSDPATCERACGDALATGAIHILVNNVGDRRVSIPIEETPLATWQEMMNLNLTSCFLCTKIIGGAMIARGRGGRIINISSMSALIANRGIAGRHYETAKAAMLHFTRCAAADWAPHGITVNAICPGLFMTGPNREWARVRPDVIQTITDATPVGRCGEPEELGPLAVYLASDAAAFVTGAAFVIDGGYTLW